MLYRMQRHAKEPHLVKTILVPLTGYENDAKALEAAYLVARRFQAHIHCLHVEPDPMGIVTQVAVQQFSSRLGNVELIHAMQKEAEFRRGKADTAYEAFLERRFANAGVNEKPSFERIEGDPVADTISAARYHGLLVLARAPEGGAFARDSIANILVGCGRPLLIAPDGPMDSIGTAIAIAWKESAEAARAVGAAMPFLNAAGRAVVLAAAESVDGKISGRAAERLARSLREEGIAADAHSFSPGTQSVTETLLNAAREKGADLLVMGAYSHSRVRELVFGGFTRDVLKSCDMPVLMLH
jgi:nucleotide-binding universal stress UspA family protein